MAWYDKNNTPEWKTFITKEYYIENLLQNRDCVILKRNVSPQQSVDYIEQETQNYLIAHHDRIVEDALNLCLKYPQSTDSYERKYLYPTKAIEIMTNQAFFNCLGWDKQLVKKYIHLLMSNFLSVDPHYDNINLYHGYFQRLFHMIIASPYVNLVEVIQAIEQQQKTYRFISQLTKHTYKQSIAACFIDLLIIDLINRPITINSEIKVEILKYCLDGLEKHDSSIPQRSELMQNILTLMKNYLEASNKADFSSNEKLFKTFTDFYSKFQQKYHLLLQILKNSENCLKIGVWEIMKANQQLLYKIKSKEIDEKWCHSSRENIINQTLNQKINVTYPHFVNWLIALLLDLGQNQDKIELLLKTNLLQRLIKVMIDNKTNNILAAHISLLLSTLFLQIDNQVKLNIQTNKAKNPELIRFKLYDEMFRVIPIIQNIIKDFKSKNDPLFTHSIKLFKKYRVTAFSILEVLEYYKILPICKQSQLKLISFIQFYSEQSLFHQYEEVTNKELGQIFIEEKVFQNMIPTEYTVLKPASLSPNPPTIAQNSFKVVIPQLQINSTLPKQEEVNAPIPNPTQTVAVEIKLNNDILNKPVEQPKVFMKQPVGEIKSLEEIKITNQNNSENLQESYESYLSKKMKEASTILSDRRSKSRTPTKIKNQLKKSKNKWGANSEDPADTENLSVSSAKKQRNEKLSLSPIKSNSFQEALPQKISMIKLTSRRKPKIYKERLLDMERDSRLSSWLKLLKEMR